ncbi:MAG: TMEM14 family protein [Chlamydiales bacterium]|nr:TMEM14 family protein [Chlamydiia bacterium]MCP5508105.1 TMEM14 family protein [Chlamydiales bacterium]
MTINYIIVAIYAAVIFIGGLIGYFKASSSASLTAGVILSAALAYCAFVMHRDHSRTALAGAVAIAGLLAAFFVYRYLITGSFMPAAVMAIISAVVAVTLIVVQTKSN